MSCERIQAQLYEYLFDLLDESAQQAVAAHVEACPACRAALDEAKRECGLLGRWTVDSPPAGLADATVQALRAAEVRPVGGAVMKTYVPVEPQWKWLGGPKFWGIVAAAAAVLVAAVGIPYYVVATRTAQPQEAFVYGRGGLTPGHAGAYRVYVRNGRTTEPVARAVVRATLASSNGRGLWRTQLVTDERGFAVIEPRVPEDAAEGQYTLRVQAVSDAGDSEVAQAIDVRRTFRVMVSTDKPLYQPGQVIHLRTLSLATADLKPVADREAILEVQDAKGNKVFKKKVRTSAFGIAAADFELADQVATGEYHVRAAVGDTTSERTVRVEPYVLPKFKIDLATDAGYYQPGDVLKGDLAAEYTFGKPVAGGRIKIVASEFIHAFTPFATVTGTTDAEGRFHFEIPLKSHFTGQELRKGDAFLSLEATVVDTADHAQKKTVDRTVTASPIRVEVFPESGRLVRDVENIVYIVTAYPDGRPAKTRLMIGATREATETTEAGIAKVKITPRTESLQLTVQAEDATGRRVRVTRALRIGTHAETVLLRTDRAVYRAGETLGLTVLSTHSTAAVFVDVIKDRRAVLEKTVVLKDGRSDLSLDLPPDLFGTLEVHAYRIDRDGNIVGDTRLIQVNRPEGLAIQARLDKATYRPAEKAILEFLVTRRDGSPAPAALSLAGVDEAVFALAEARPGLERVYFMLQEEILRPRYELHASLPATPEEAVRTDVPPTPDREEAAVVLFSTAEGTSAPKVQKSETFAAKQQRFEREHAERSEGLGFAIALAPLGLFILLTLPLVLYAFSKFFHRRPIEGRPQDVREVQDAVRGIARWWGLGFYLPVVAGIAGAFMGGNSPGAAVLACVAVAVVVVLVMLSLWVGELGKAKASRAVPLLRKFCTVIPVAYVVSGLAVVWLFDTANSRLDADTVLLLSVVLVLWMAVVASAMVVARMALTQDSSAVRLIWTAANRLVIVSVPAILMLIVVLGAMRTVRCSLSRWDAAKGGAVPAMWDEPGNPELKSAAEAPMPAAPAHPAAAPAPAPDAATAPPRIRRFFPETLFWQPQLVTDDRGRARLEVPLADSITTWRVAMSAVSQDGRLGAAEAVLRVFQDFFVDIDLPVALTQNDVVSVPVAVYNYLDKPQTVRLEASPAAWFDLLGEPVQSVSMAAREVRAVAFRLRAKTPGRHTLLVKAFGSELSDAIERQVAVRPDGREVVQTLNGRLDKSLLHEIVIPDGAIDGASDLFVKIYPGAFSQVVEGLDSIFQMPYGCFEQTSSTTYPNILVLDYLRRTRLAKPAVEMKALGFINQGYQRLLTFEVKGGGFEWFGHEPAHLVLTAYGLMEFADMARVHEVDPEVISRTRRWLYSRQQADGSWPANSAGSHEIGGRYGQSLQTTAYVAWALAESGKVDAELIRALDFLAAKVDTSTDTYTLALAAAAMTAAKRPEADRLLADLDGRKVTEDRLVHWTSAGQGATFSRGNVLDIETTALAARALLVAGRNVPTAHKALEWLIAHKDPRGTWHSTQATVHAMRALLAGAGNGGGIDRPMKVTLTANGRVARELDLTPDTADLFHLVSLRPFVQAGRNVVALEAGAGGNLAYQIVATHYVPWPRTAPGEGGKELDIDVAYDTTTLKTNDLLTARVTIRYNRPGAAPMAIVDLGLPPGFEVLPEAFQKLKDAGVIERFTMTGRQVILYFREIPGGKPIVFTYQLRAKFPVRAKTPPSAVYPYYEPALRSEAAPVVLTVM